MVLIFLLLFTSYTVAMDDDVNDGPFTPKHFDAFLKKIDDEKLQAYQEKQKKIIAAECTARVINVPPIIVRKKKPVPHTDDDDHGTTASNSSPSPAHAQIDDIINDHQPAPPEQP